MATTLAPRLPIYAAERTFGAENYRKALVINALGGIDDSDSAVTA